MLAYFARRMIGGVVTWLLASFMLYSLLVSPAIQDKVPDCICYPDVLHGWVIPPRLENSEAKVHETLYALDRPWPLNYLTWLVATEGRKGSIFTPFDVLHGNSPTQIVSSSIIAGDFGYSTFVEEGAPVLLLYGINLALLLSFIFAILFSAMLIVALQRRGRSPVYGFAAPVSPAKTIWRRAELWPLG